MSGQTEHASVKRVRDFLAQHDIEVEIRKLSETARSAADAANALNVQVGQIASSIVFALTDDESKVSPLLVITSGRHRVDTALVEESENLAKLGRADADFVRSVSGFAIGGVSPVAWLNGKVIYQPKTYIDVELSEYDEIWAAAGHTHVVFRTNFEDLKRISAATAIQVGN
jgi:prolyl-tRNA editing enzyme YbaK/EbsC (Cys-tRNA(Pro) deacylase)